MTIIWNDKFLIDNGVIDADHRDLIRIINKFSQFDDNKFIVKNIKETLAELKLYTIDHFAREEQIQQKIGYPLSETHARQHVNMVRQLDIIIDDLRATLNNRNMKYDVIRDKIFNLLKVWLVQHILIADASLKPHFDNDLSKH